MGADTKKQDAQLNLQNQLQQQQQAKQNAITDSVTASLNPYLGGNKGFSPQQIAAMTSSALDQNALRYGQAAQTTNSTLAARGENGLTPLSGVAATGYGNLQASRAADLSDALRNVTLNNAQQANANQFNAASVLSGNAQTLAGNVANYGSGASNALSNLTTAQQGGFFNNFTKSFASGLGGGIGAGVTGGVGTVAQGAGKALTNALGWGRG